MAEYKNGSAWYHPAWCIWMVLQVLPNKMYCLIAISEGMEHNVGSVVTDPDGSGKWEYKDTELGERLSGWSRVDRVEIGIHERIE